MSRLIWKQVLENLKIITHKWDQAFSQFFHTLLTHMDESPPNVDKTAINQKQTSASSQLKLLKVVWGSFVANLALQMNI